ncbi:MAG: omptin family outer membrane protease [Candidatus Zixiibacteriota bacterium]
MLALVSSTQAQKQYEFTVAPATGQHFGDTRFRLNFLYLLPDSSIGSGGSELVFPLDATFDGLELGFRYWKDGHQLWTGNLRAIHSITEPRSNMMDEDWDNVGQVRLLWSHTDSETDATLAELNIEATRLVAWGKSAELAVVAGVGLQKFKFRMTDLTGWQYLDLDSNGQTEVYVVDENVVAGTYETRYLRPEIGLMPRLLADPFVVEFKAVVSPLLYTKDVDDHLLRFFQIHTNGRGFGYGGRIAVEYNPRGRGGARFYARVSGEARGAEIDVSGYREYYATVNAGGQIIYSGTRFAEQHVVNTTQYGVHFSIGLSF